MSDTILTRVAPRLALILCAALFTLGSPTSAEAEPEYVLKFQSVAPNGTPWARQAQRLKKFWEKGSEGRLKVKLFLGRGNEIALVRKCKAGELQAIGVSTSAMLEEIPAMGVFELPYLFTSNKESDRIIDNHLFKPTEALLRKNGFQLYIFSENGYRHFATKGKEIHAPADLATLKMRSQENWIHEEMYKALGGNPVRISVAEVLTSLSTNQVNGFDNTALYSFATSWINEIDTWTVSDHIYQPAVVVYNRTWFDKLPKDIQELLLANREEETKKGRRAIRRLTPKLLKKLEEKDIKVYKMTAAEKATFRQKTAKVRNMFKTKGGKDGAKMLDIINKQSK
ncbi:MAG: TRAP transporter substrate-binding protein [Myxococcota bacterium]